MIPSSLDHVLDLLPAYVDRTLAPDAQESVRAHLMACESCATALAEWEVIASATQAAAAVASSPSRGLIDRVFARIDAAERTPSWYARWLPARLRQPLPARLGLGSLAAVGIALIVSMSPLGLYAENLLDRFQPRQFAVVPISMADLRALPSLREYGQLSELRRGEPREVASPAEASAASGLRVLTPASLPVSVNGPPAYGVVPSFSGTFTFRAERARGAAEARGRELPSMPANIDGSSVQITTGAGVIAVYGADLLPAGARGPTTAKPASATGPKPERRDGPPDMVDIAEHLPQLLIGQAFVPAATSTGASPAELQRYLLSQPGISANLTNAIRAIGDPTQTWPIPVPIDKVRTRGVTVQGVRGTLFSDASGFVTGVIWVKDGVVYGVGGPLGESDVLAVANSLR